MPEAGDGQDTSPELTPTDAASFFETALTADEGDTETPAAKPPTHESPESESDEAEAAPEQAEVEDESPEGEEQDEEPEAQPAEELFTVTVDGKPLQVTKDELLKSYSRQADYTRKTQELAEQRKAHEAESTAARDERKRLAASLTQLETALKQVTPKEPDWTVARATMEPAEFAAEYAAWSQHKEEMKALKAEREAAEAAVRADDEKAFRTHIAEQNRLLTEALPELKDPEKSKTLRSEFVAAAESVGFTKADVEGITDHRLMLLLSKAAKYDKAQKARPAIQQRIEKVKTATPGTPGTVVKKQPSAAAAAQKRLAQTGSIRDAAASGVFG